MKYILYTYVCIAEDTCEKIWTSLKQKYTRERKKCKLPSGRGPRDSSTWVWFTYHPHISWDNLKYIHK